MRRLLYRTPHFVCAPMASLKLCSRKKLENKDLFGQFDPSCHFMGRFFHVWGSKMPDFCTGLTRRLCFVIHDFSVVVHFLKFFSAEFENRANINYSDKHCQFIRRFFPCVGLQFASIFDKFRSKSLFYHILNLSCGATVFRSVFFAIYLENQAFSTISVTFYSLVLKSIKKLLLALASNSHQTIFSYILMAAEKIFRLLHEIVLKIELFLVIRNCM